MTFTELLILRRDYRKQVETHGMQAIETFFKALFILSANLVKVRIRTEAAVEEIEFTLDDGTVYSLDREPDAEVAPVLWAGMQHLKLMYDPLIAEIMPNTTYEQTRPT